MPVRKPTQTDSVTVSAEALSALMDRLASLEAQLSAAQTPTKRVRVPAKAKPAPVVGTATKARVIAGTRPGYIQLQFEGKPTDAVRDALKAKGYRWNRVTALWWGKSDAFPQAKVGATVTIK
jgi:hypothetical protein